MKKVFNVIAAIFGKFSALLLMAMIAVVATQVVSRSLGYSVLWTEELARYIQIWLAYAGMVTILIKGDALCVDFLKVMYSKRMLKVLEIFSGIITLAISGYLSYYGYVLCSSRIYQNSTTPVLLWPKWVPYSIIPITMAIIAAFSIYQIISAIIRLCTHEDEEGKAEIYGHIENIDEMSDEGIEHYITLDEMKKGGDVK